VLRALGFESGYTHMEWFLTPRGEAVFGEIGARAPARACARMNYSCDADLFAGWAEAVCFGRLSQPTKKKYNAACMFKRASGQGRIQRYEGLERCSARYGEHIPVVELNPIGAPRKDWKNSVVGDGWLVARHPNLELTLEIADHIATDLRIVRGVMDASADARPPKPGLLEATAILTLISGIVHLLAFGTALLWFVFAGLATSVSCACSSRWRSCRSSWASSSAHALDLLPHPIRAREPAKTLAIVQVCLILFGNVIALATGSWRWSRTRTRRC
jgi:hypothetical protein